MRGEYMLSQASLRDVFISYSSHDTKVVTPIVRRLEQEGLSRFFAPTEIRAGGDVNLRWPHCDGLIWPRLRGNLAVA
jgi:hypothetical protein